MKIENHSGQFVPKGTSIVWTLDRICSLRDMNKDESKFKVGIDDCKAFLKVSPKTTVVFCKAFK